MRELFYADAIRESLMQNMREDDRIYVYGEDVSGYGGVFGVTSNLVEEFGDMRVRSTPLSEAAILGEAVGSALYGLRPVPEIQFGDFITVAMSQVVDLMASYHYRVGSALPLTIRVPSGGMLAIGNFHSNCWEAWFAHVPGLKVVIPSSAYDAKGLLTASIKDPNPVLFFEQKRLYRLIKDEVPEDNYEIELGKARVVEEGDDITLITYGNMMTHAREAVQLLKQQGVSVELIDLRTIVPFDRDTVKQSFSKTKRAIVLHEAREFCGFGAEVTSFLQAECFDSMAAPIKRIGSMQTPVPMNPILEKAYLPSIDEIIAAATELMEY